MIHTHNRRLHSHYKSSFWRLFYRTIQPLVSPSTHLYVDQFVSSHNSRMKKVLFIAVWHTRKLRHRQATVCLWYALNWNPRAAVMLAWCCLSLIELHWNSEPWERGEFLPGPLQDIMKEGVSELHPKERGGLGLAALTRTVYRGGESPSQIPEVETCEGSSENTGEVGWLSTSMHSVHWKPANHPPGTGLRPGTGCPSRDCNDWNCSYYCRHHAECFLGVSH